MRGLKVSAKTTSLPLSIVYESSTEKNGDLLSERAMDYTNYLFSDQPMAPRHFRAISMIYYTCKGGENGREYKRKGINEEEWND